MADTITTDEPPLDLLDPSDFGPDDPDGYIIPTPDERPYTALLFDPDSRFAGGQTLEATALVIVHAATPAAAAEAATIAVQRAARSTAAWRYPELLFLTEGYHEDLGPGSRRKVR